MHLKYINVFTSADYLTILRMSRNAGFERLANMFSSSNINKYTFSFSSCWTCYHVIIFTCIDLLTKFKYLSFFPREPREHSSLSLNTLVYTHTLFSYCCAVISGLKFLLYSRSSKLFFFLLSYYSPWWTLVFSRISNLETSQQHIFMRWIY